ncbi:ATP-binding cassette domain-containing protein [bacterium]|nr:ATP-binding cassette domain-containing protein [bacterium]
MSHLVLQVDRVSKRFQIGTREPYYRLSESLYHLGNAARQWPRKLWRQGTRCITETEATTRDFWALNDVSFEVREGEVVGIIGHNGAGKSTLLKILSRITEATSGRIRVRGRVGSLLEVGTGFHPELTGRENIYLNGAILGMSRAEVRRRFDEIVAFADVEQFLDTPVKRYSSGMYVRLGFAVAAHLEPEILIIDEVLAVGDAAFQKKCLGKMSDVARSGRTVLFVSHNLVAVRSLCQRVLWLDHGESRDINETGHVLQQYLSDIQRPCLEKHWGTPDTAPGTPAVRLKRIAAFSDNEDPRQLTIGSSIHLEIDFWALEDQLLLNPSVVLQTAEGVPVFNTYPMLRNSILAEPLSRGEYRCTCTIPPHLLNDETYRLQLYMIRDRSACEWRIDDALLLTIADDTSREEWYGKVIGAVRPQLSWSAIPLLSAPETTGTVVEGT